MVMEKQEKAQVNVQNGAGNGEGRQKVITENRKNVGTTAQKNGNASPKRGARKSTREAIEVDMSAPMGECAREWVKVYGEHAEHNVFIKNELDRQYNAMIKRLADSFRAAGGVGAVNMNFAKMYCKIAEAVFKRFGKKYLPDAFNAYWNARLAAETRIGIKPGGVAVHVVSTKHSSRAVHTSLGWLNDFIIPANGAGGNVFQRWFNTEVRNVAVVDDCGEGVVYWNDSVQLDHEFVRVYLNRYFDSAVLHPFFEELKTEAEGSEYATYNVEWFAYSFSDTVFDKDLSLKAIKFWSGITNEGIFRMFAEFAARENLTITPYPEVGILIGVGENLHKREIV